MSLNSEVNLEKLYNRSSLRNSASGVRLSLKNRLAPVKLTRIDRIELNGEVFGPERIQVTTDSGDVLDAEKVGADDPMNFPLGTLLIIDLATEPLEKGRHQLTFAFETKEFGPLEFSVEAELGGRKRPADAIPRDDEDDYDSSIVETRQAFVRDRTGVALEHISACSFDPHAARGNIENLIGVAQVPMGLAGPLRVEGENATGRFYVPLATSEGTLVASYNRGMRVINESGGVKCAVVGDHMQRAPVFIFEDAASARRFADWLAGKTDEIREICGESDPFVKLKYVDYYLANKFAFTRFNFTTGDAAGMNMVGKATFAACNWIMSNYQQDRIVEFFLEGNFATDKKASMINTMRTRGKRVTAETTVKRDVLRNVMDADTVSLYQHSKTANIGALISGANNNGCHAANAITAIFIATGQDVANVAESSTGLLYTELTAEKDLYISITLPSLIVGTCGGGTGLPTQQEGLKIMDCAGVGKVMKFAEIIAGTVLAGEISLAAAISSLDWVSSHDQYGRNDPGRQ
ncbi:hydroxymethylglutaryl-CoA reductase [Marinobacter sp.]|uniref:hydroxymethylglutaryl-CoA reductase n=1 Tax=Marinobacter sp. TaxID=50741 RepID=UPI00384C0D1A